MRRVLLTSFYSFLVDDLEGLDDLAAKVSAAIRDGYAAAIEFKLQLEGDEDQLARLGNGGWQKLTEYLGTSVTVMAGDYPDPFNEDETT